MSCGAKVTWEDLVLYWANDLQPAEVARVDEHLMGCASCSAESARVFALTEGLRAIIPPVVSRDVLRALQARGTRVEENVFAPGDRRTVVFSPTADLMIHRLSGFDLSNAQSVSVVVRVEGSGEVLVEVPDAPFDVHDGVLLACQRHYAAMPPDTVFEVHAHETSGAESRADYTILHVFPE